MRLGRKKAHLALGEGGPEQGLQQSAYQYGRRAEPLPDMYLFSTLTERDAALAQEISRRHAGLETLARDISERAEQLAAPRDERVFGAEPRPAKRRGWFSRDGSRHEGGHRP